MRNLKRALSLTLASVMLLGMMVMGTSAAGFPDVDEEDNVEAIEVLKAVEVMVGDDNGNFDPDRNVSRTEMAVVMAKLLNLDYQYYEASCPFWDVPTWAKGYVGACYANGITSGYSATTYGAADSITPVQAASMMMRALGYFQYKEDYKDGFELVTVKQGTDIGIFNGVGSSATAPMTRNQVAKMALNALRSNMVAFTGTPGTQYTAASGETLSIGYRAEYTPRTSPEAKYNAITNLVDDIANTNQYYIQLGEQLYDGDLRLNDNDLDVFQRPARTWEFEGKEIGTYVKTELLRKDYSVKVTGKMLYDLLTKNTIDKYDFVIAIDGETSNTVLGTAYFTENDLTRSNDDAVGATGKGVTTEVYVDTNDEVVYIAIINTYLAQADDDYDEKDDELDLLVYNIQDQNSSSRNPAYVKAADDEPMTVDGEDFDIEDVKEDDLFLVTVADGEIQTMKAPEILSNVVIDAFKIDDYVVTGSDQYDHASTARYDVDVLNQWNDSNLKELTYNIILDQYGYLIGLERNEDPDEYVFLTGIDSGASNLYATRADANIIHMDGTMETVKVDLTKSRDGLSGSTRLLAGYTGNLSQVNIWCKYSVSTDGVYTLKKVPVATNADVRPATSPKVAQFAQDVGVYDDSANGGTATIKEINEKRVSLIGWDEISYGNLGTGEKYVYGNDDTVYINVTLDEVVVDDNTNGGRNRNIVDDVDSVTVGVKNVNLEMKNLPTNTANGFRNPAAEIYTLYNDKGIVIAAVTIGEDNGTSTNFAYITGGINREEYGHSSSTKATEGKWTWYRDAIVDGKKTRLTETGDTLDVLDDLVVGDWYEIKYTADGDVRRANHIGYDSGYTFTANGKYVNMAENVEKAVNTVSGNTVLLSDITTVDVLNFKNGTLYTDTNDTKGFHVSSDVKVVVANANKAGTTEFDSITDNYTGYSGVEKAIRDMNCRGTAPSGTPKIGDGTKWIELSAIMTNGFASVIVINDKSPVTTGGTTVTPSADSLSITVDANSLTVDAQFLFDTSNGARRTNIMNALRNAGATVTSIDPTSALEWAIDSQGRNWQINITNYYRVSLDGTVVEYLPTTAPYLTKALVVTGKGTSLVQTNTSGSIGGPTTSVDYVVSYKTYAKGDNIPCHMDLKTGYVLAPASHTGAGGTTRAVWTVTGSKTDIDGTGYMPYNGTLTLVGDWSNTDLTLNHDVTVTITPADAGTITGGNITLSGTDKTTNPTRTVTISNVTKDITMIKDTYKTAEAPTELDTAKLVKTGNGLTVTVISEPENLDQNTPAKIILHISGQNITTGGTLTLAPGAGSETIAWNQTNLPGGITPGASGLILNYGTGSYNDDLEIIITATSATKAEPTLTIAP